MEILANFLNSGKCYLCDFQNDQIICFKCFSKLEAYNLDEKLDGINIYSLYFYNQTSSKILLMSKYPPYHFYVLKYLIRNSSIPNFSRNTILCPVPLGSLKMFERRFNQAELIANEISFKQKLPVFSILNRVRETKPLFNLSKEMRKSELTDAFKTNLWANAILNKNKYKIVLVDDLITSGETIVECLKALKISGFNNIGILSLFRA